ncbi:MAG TPA: alpha-galactosidase [Lachnospiraceae bacterium]|nr:alpha-galactosidase [Lachnospiraceae bacterium]
MKKETGREPNKITDRGYRYDAFSNGTVLWNKKKGHLPSMGWNSWNAFGSGNTEELTKKMVDAMVELGLDKLGYQYMVLDDGCYKSERVEGKLANETMKFPGGFKALSDYIHEKGLKFGMYNDIGTNLCAGAAVGTCGHEMTDAQSYLDWGVDFIKVDNCYYLWDNATFSDATNARYVYAPNIQSIQITGENHVASFSAVKDGFLRGEKAEKKQTYVTNIGTYDGTGPWASPVGERSGELTFLINAPKAGEYKLIVNYASGKEEGIGEWLQVATGEKDDTTIFYDDLLPVSETTESFIDSQEIAITLRAGENLLRLMNHRRQENTLSSYAALLEGFALANPKHDIILSICEWGKTQPQNWGYKVGDSWRILNDITFRVGADGDPGVGSWIDDYTPSVTSQYNKAVIMDEFSGLDKGWNDPDMLMIGMNGLTDTMCKTHMTMWCMMNAPLMLGLDLRRVKKGDAIWEIIANKALIDLNQDALGIQAKRVYCSLEQEHPDTAYITNRDRVDILAKPLKDGGVAISFINVSETEKDARYSVHVKDLIQYLGAKMINSEVFAHAKSFTTVDLWTGEELENTTGCFEVKFLKAYDSVTMKVVPHD